MIHITLQKSNSSDLLYIADKDLLTSPEYLFSTDEEHDTTILKAYLSLTKDMWCKLLMFTGVNNEDDMILDANNKCFIVVKGCLLYLDDIWGESVASQLTFNSDTGKVDLFHGK